MLYGEEYLTFSTGLDVFFGFPFAIAFYWLLSGINFILKCFDIHFLNVVCVFLFEKYGDYYFGAAILIFGELMQYFCLNRKFHNKRRTRKYNKWFRKTKLVEKRLLKSCLNDFSSYLYFLKSGKKTRSTYLKRTSKDRSVFYVYYYGERDAILNCFRMTIKTLKKYLKNLSKKEKKIRKTINSYKKAQWIVIK